MKESEQVSSKASEYIRYRKLIFLLIVVILLVVILALVWLLFFYEKKCTESVCFYNAMSECKRFSWIREDEKAAWLYTIIGNAKNDQCRIEVRLLRIKDGSMEIEKLQDKSMVCTVDKQETASPEKDMSKCTGTLKEELQEILIQRLHNYLVQNVGEVKQGLL